MVPETEKQQFLREMRGAIQEVVAAGDRFRNLSAFTEILAEISDEDIAATFGGYTLADFQAALAGLGAGLSGVTEDQQKAIRKFSGVSR